jgi:uncharacterized protein YlxW (UPF0749 family)
VGTAGGDPAGPAEVAGSDSRASGVGRWAVFACTVAGGLLFAAAATTSAGLELRSTGGDIASVVKERTEQVARRGVGARGLQTEVDRLATRGTRPDGSAGTGAADEALRFASGLLPVQGNGMRVELSDTPRTVDFPDVDPNFLVVHQQDIQAYVNALWAGGAEAVALQGQRLVTTSGIKCVGNTVVIDGVPYSPPYVIEAVGEPLQLRAALNRSAEVETYRDYAEKYQLGLAEDEIGALHIEGYDGPIAFRYAKPLTGAAPAG